MRGAVIGVVLISAALTLTAVPALLLYWLHPQPVGVVIEVTLAWVALWTFVVYCIADNAPRSDE